MGLQHMANPPLDPGTWRVQIPISMLPFLQRFPFIVALGMISAMSTDVVQLLALYVSSNFEIGFLVYICQGV